MKLAGAFETQSLLEGASASTSASSLHAFSKAAGWSKGETEAFPVALRKD